MNHDFDIISLHELQDLLSIPSERHTHLLCDERSLDSFCREDFTDYHPRNDRNRGR